MKLCFETSRLLDASGRIQRQKLVPEEDSILFFKHLKTNA